MKRFKLAILISFVLMFLTVPLSAQTTTDNLTKVTLSGGLYMFWDDIALDSAGTAWSQAFDLSTYDNGTTQLFLCYDAAVSDSIKLYLYSQTVDSWIASDSLTLESLTGACDTMTVSFKSRAYKFKATNLPTKAAETGFDLGVYTGTQDIEVD